MKLSTTSSRIAILELSLLVSFTITSSYAQKPNTPSPAPTSQPKNIPATRTSSPTMQAVTPTNTPGTAPEPSDRCIIFIDGSGYDLTEFRKSHSGGDIFTCGADMSAIFWQQHDQAHLDQLSRYRI